MEGRTGKEPISNNNRGMGDRCFFSRKKDMVVERWGGGLSFPGQVPNKRWEKGTSGNRGQEFWKAGGQERVGLGQRLDPDSLVRKGLKGGDQS